jgi:myo-inositol-1(or 4)-monophosphatase
MSDHRPTDLIPSIQQAGELLMQLWPGATATADALGIRTKADGTLVSQADMQSNERVLAAIREMFPHHAILSEESPSDVDALARSPRTWVVDPLDGTSSFLHGRDDFSILVGLCENLVPTAGIMLFPARNLLVIGEQGRGATANGRQLSVSGAQTLEPGRVYIRNFESLRPELACPMMDSGLALLKVANGELDGAIIRMTTHREWDLAAPIAIIREAGGSVVTETGAQVQCGRGYIDFQYVIASNGTLYQQLRGIIPE